MGSVNVHPLLHVSSSDRLTEANNELILIRSYFLQKAEKGTTRRRAIRTLLLKEISKRINMAGENFAVKSAFMNRWASGCEKTGRSG